MTGLKYKETCAIYEQGGMFYSAKKGQPVYATDNPRLAVIHFAGNVESAIIDKIMSEAAADGYDYYTGERRARQ